MRREKNKATVSVSVNPTLNSAQKHMTVLERSLASDSRVTSVRLKEKYKTTKLFLWCIQRYTLEKQGRPFGKFTSAARSSIPENQAANKVFLVSHPLCPISSLTAIPYFHMNFNLMAIFFVKNGSRSENVMYFSELYFGGYDIFVLLL